VDFGQALHNLKNGKRVYRDGWNGKHMFLFLVPGSHFTVNRPPLLGIYPEGTGIDYRSHIDMVTAQGDVVPWVASQSDLLADDWNVQGEAVGSGLPNHALNAGLREETPSPKFVHPDDIEDAATEIVNADIDKDGPIPFNE